MSFLSVNVGNAPAWAWLLMLLIVVPEALSDIRNKTIYVFPVFLGTFVGLGVGFLPGRSVADSFMGCIPGIFLLLVSMVCKGCIGKGDGEVLLMIGAFLGFRSSVSVLLSALLTAMLYCLFLMGIGKAGRKSRIPFVPFLLSGLCISGGLQLLC